jgi:hypothetical protein
MNQLAEIAEKVKEMVDENYLYFPDRLQVKLSPHSHPVNLWGVCASPAGKVYVMDSDEQWHEVKAHEKNILSSLYQRIQALSVNYKKIA